MKLLLTDAGIRNASIQEALVDLLGKPISESTALFVTTASYAHQNGVFQAYRALAGAEDGPSMTQLGWKAVGLLELTALPSIDRDLWVPVLQAADALLVGGGDAAYLAHWMRESGLADLLPGLDDLVYVGLSAGSMVLTPNIGKEFVSWPSRGADDTTLGVVDFGIFPHVAPPGEPGNTMEQAEKWAAARSGRAYVTDNETAIRVVDGQVDVISEGEWRVFDN